MIGQLYKDFKMAWMTFFFLGFMAFVMALLGPEDGGTPDEMAESVLIILSGLAMLNMMVPMIAMQEVTMIDEKERWADFVMALPGGLKTYVCSKYIFIVLINVIAALFTHIFCLVTDMLWDNPLWSQMLSSAHVEYMIIGAAAGLGMLIAAFFFPFVFCFGMKAANAVGTVFILGIGLAFYIFFMFGDTTILENFAQRVPEFLFSHYRLIGNIIKALLPIGIAAMCGSCALAVRACKYGMTRREYWE